MPQGEGHCRKGLWGHCQHLPISRAAANPHQHLRCFRRPQLVPDLAPPGDIFATSQAPNPAAHCGVDSPAFVFMGKAPGSVAVGQTTEVVAVGYAVASPGAVLVARLADPLPWYLHHQPMYLPCLLG